MYYALISPSQKVDGGSEIVICKAQNRFGEKLPFPCDPESGHFLVGASRVTRVPSTAKVRDPGA